jgi:ankyrin repeat domain-containing protein 50
MSDPLTIAVSVVGIVSLGIQVCQGLVSYYGSWKDGRQDISRTLRSVEGLQATLEQLSAVLPRLNGNAGAAKTVEDNVRSCEASIQELDEELKRIGSFAPAKGEDGDGSSTTTLRVGLRELRSRGGRLLYPFRESTLLKLREVVDDVRANLTLSVTTLHL